MPMNRGGQIYLIAIAFTHSSHLARSKASSSIQFPPPLALLHVLFNRPLFLLLATSYCSSSISLCQQKSYPAFSMFSSVVLSSSYQPLHIVVLLLKYHHRLSSTRFHTIALHLPLPTYPTSHSV